MTRAVAMTRFPLILVACALAACAPPATLASSPVAKLHALGAVPAVWRQWWSEDMRCARVDALPPMDSIVVHVLVYEGPRIPIAGAVAVAAFVPPERAGEGAELWIARPYLESRVVVAHELMHAVLFASTGQRRGHPDRFFGAANGCGLQATYAGI